MKFKMQSKAVGSEDSSAWWEEYTENITDAYGWAKDTIDRFNRTLKEGEKPRELMDVIVLDHSINKEVKETYQDEEDDGYSSEELEDAQEEIENLQLMVRVSDMLVRTKNAEIAELKEEIKRLKHPNSPKSA